VHISDISTLAASQAAQPTPSLSPFAASFEALLGEFKDEYVKLDLDDVVVGAIAQVVSCQVGPCAEAHEQMRQAFADWDPFDVSSDALLSTLKQWRRAYRLPADGDPASMDQGRGMTAWESLLWALWLPKVRSSVK
jgi:tuftelin-interacting protein 11